MADPIWVDTNVVARITEGDFALKAELQALRAAGHPLLLPPKVKEELLVGNPFNKGPVKPMSIAKQ